MWSRRKGIYGNVPHLQQQVVCSYNNCKIVHAVGQTMENIMGRVRGCLSTLQFMVQVDGHWYRCMVHFWEGLVHSSSWWLHDIHTIANQPVPYVCLPEPKNYCFFGMGRIPPFWFTSTTSSCLDWTKEDSFSSLFKPLDLIGKLKAFSCYSMDWELKASAFYNFFFKKERKIPHGRRRSQEGTMRRSFPIYSFS